MLRTFERKINVIKNFRQVTDLGLREAKILVAAAEQTGMLEEHANRPDAESTALMRLVAMTTYAQANNISADVLRDTMVEVYQSTIDSDLRRIVESHIK